MKIKLDFLNEGILQSEDVVDFANFLKDFSNSNDDGFLKDFKHVLTEEDRDDLSKLANDPSGLKKVLDEFGRTVVSEEECSIM